MISMHDKVRLSEKYITAIIEAFEGNFDTADHLWVFGSRVDLQAKGGDIDLYIETHETDLDKAIQQKSKMVSQLWRAIGEQKIDVVLNILSLNSDLSIYNIAKQSGVLLK